MKHDWQDDNKTRRLVNWFSVLVVIESLLTIWLVVSIPTDPKNAIWGGLSLLRIILIGLIVLIIFGVLGIFTAYHRDMKIWQQVDGFMLKPINWQISGGVGWFLASLALIPPGEWGKWQLAFERLLPLLILLALVFSEWSFAGILRQGNLHSRITRFRKMLRPHLKMILIGVGVLIGLYFLSTVLYPISSNEDYWYETGIPLLPWQVFAALLAGLLYRRFDDKLQDRLNHRHNLILFLAIFILCGALWAAMPLRSSFFGPGPFPPNNEFYPASDARTFDLQSQSAQVGYGLNFGRPLDRPFYPVFLSVVNLIIGPNYAVNMAVQAFLFGILPAIIYLIGAEVGSRSLGISASLAVGLWVSNGILLIQKVNTATPKQVLSDFPLSIVLALVLYLTIRWQRRFPEDNHPIIVIGGLLALAAYIRYSALPLVLLWIIAMLFFNRFTWKRRFILIGLLVTGFFIVTIPWHVRNIQRGGQWLTPFGEKISYVVHTRYGSGDFLPDSEDQQDSIDDQTGGMPSEGWQDGQSSEAEWRKGNQKGNDLEKPFLNWFGSHFLHNVMSSILVLPTSLEFASPETSWQLSGEVWAQYWDGRLPLPRLIMIVFQFFILSVGFVKLYHRDRNIAVFAVFIFLGVLGANSFGRTSGGRYIVPVNWLVLLIYMGGVLALSGKMETSLSKKRQPLHSNRKKDWRKYMGGFLLVLMVGLLPVIFEQTTTFFFRDSHLEQSFADVQSLEITSDSIPDYSEIAAFLNQDKSRGFPVYALYPYRDFINSDTQPGRDLNLEGKIATINFTALYNSGSTEVIFPYKGTIDLQSGDRVWMTTCHTAWVVVVRDLFVYDGENLKYYPSTYPINWCQ